MGRRLSGERGSLQARSLAAGQFGIVGDRKRVADQKTLHFITKLFGEECELRGVLDTLGAHRQLKAASEPDDGADDGRRLRIPFQIRDEGLVDLDLIEGE